ncbi:O-antigen ligase family protein [Alkalinema sp. FACHB-956]|uniref:O-antigen ligase family protein n=1 Tax=Alkalinema sp. FACHB-956 TaxID=2692768 RepID=UPI00168670C3|nr:O-antigen ligase family protein [Alkalinema sp. FACHB-956]MBD2326303.1 O-antigen ligase family protein [Alkalinema sp. FACHB-956]
MPESPMPDSSMPDSSAPDSAAAQTSASRPLLALLTAALYALFTLLPDSSTVVVSWPWVFIWQVALLCPVLWLLGQGLQTRRWLPLGQGWDGIAIAAIVTIVLSSITAVFPTQARWYGAAALCLIATLYALNHWLTTTHRRIQLLQWQGYLSLGFIATSLGLWASQTWLPTLQRLQALQQTTGVSLPFNLSVLENRNWAPIGHQNYVAGYLLLAIPLLIGLGLENKGMRKWLWWGGAGLGFLDLYTTASRSALLTVVVVLVALGAVHLTSQIQIRQKVQAPEQGPDPQLSDRVYDLGRDHALDRLPKTALPKQYVLAGLGIVGLMLALVVSTGRLQGIFRALQGGYVPGEFGYRLITLVTGWKMGLSRPITGQGLGSVPLLYQQYRPDWAGQEAEWAFQLHSTPAQLWAELGLPGLGLGVATIGLLGFQWWRDRDRHSPLIYCLFASLFAYALQSLSDYQLDNLCISGMIVVILSVIISSCRNGSSELFAEDQENEFSDVRSQGRSRISTIIPIGAISALLLVIVSLWPIYQGWLLSSQGFNALQQVETSKIPEEKQAFFDRFVQSLTDATKVAPWEPYYAYQLAWNLGDVGLKTSNPQLLEQAIGTFRNANQMTASQEFGHTNLGWLLLNREPKAAAQEFAQAAKLLPAKRGVLYGLGLSLLYDNQLDRAIEAIALEVIRDPNFMASPLWRDAKQKPLFDQVLKRSEGILTDFLSQAQNEILIQSLRFYRSRVRWWMGNLTGAKEDAQASNYKPLQAAIDLANNQALSDTLKAELSPTLSATIAAWTQPNQRPEQLTAAWVNSISDAPPPGMMEQLQASMERSASFDQWIKLNAPANPARRSRVGFGVLSRHIDGPLPSDFLTVSDNVGTTVLMPDVFPRIFYDPQLDTLLEPLQTKLVEAVSPKSRDR